MCFGNCACDGCFGISTYKIVFQLQLVVANRLLFSGLIQLIAKSLDDCHTEMGPVQFCGKRVGCWPAGSHRVGY